MALPTTIVSDVGLMGYHPPWPSSGGAFYSVVRADADELDVYKTTDPADSWTVQDSGDGPVHAGTIVGYATVQDGDVIHMIVWSSATYEYYTFDMSTDQWGVDQLIETPANAPDQPWGSIAVRADGDIVVVYSGDTDRVMGGAKERVDVNIRTSGTWGGPVALDAAGDIHYGNPNCVLGTNDFVHCIWAIQRATTSDPPIGWDKVAGRSVDPSDDSLSTTASAFISTPLLLSYQNLVSYNDGTDHRMLLNGTDHDGITLDQVHGIEDVNDEISSVAVFGEILTDRNYTNGEVTIGTLTELNGELHWLYSGGGTKGVDQDLYYTTSTDDGLNWSATSEEIDAITVNFISGTIYERDIDTVFAYVYDDFGVQKYNEKVLIAGQTHQMML